MGKVFQPTIAINVHHYVGWPVSRCLRPVSPTLGTRFLRTFLSHDAGCCQRDSRCTQKGWPEPRGTNRRAAEFLRRVVPRGTPSPEVVIQGPYRPEVSLRSGVKDNTTRNSAHKLARVNRIGAALSDSVSTNTPSHQTVYVNNNICLFLTINSSH